MNTPMVRMPLQPFPVPTSVSITLRPGRRQDGMRTSPVLELDELDFETLDDLAWTWLCQLYASVKRRPPWQEIVRSAPK